MEENGSYIKPYLPSGVKLKEIRQGTKRIQRSRNRRTESSKQFKAEEEPIKAYLSICTRREKKTITAIIASSIFHTNRK